MKIGYLTQTLNRGTGGGRFAADIIDGVKASGHQVIVLKELNDNSEGLAILGRGIRTVTCVPKVINLLKSCDVIHALDGYPYGITAWLANIFIKRKLFISALGTYAVAPLYRSSTAFLLKRAYKSANKVIAISNFTKNEILKKVKIENIVVVTPGIDTKQIEIISNKQDKFIISVGGIKERKGYHISIEAFGLIKDKFPDFKYIIVGDKDDAWQTILDKVIQKYDLKDRVVFMSNVSENKLEELYDNASLFILTPINTPDHHIEGFGLVYLEAARSGLAVIGTLGTGAEDAINNGKNGILVKQNDPENTADAMSKILSNDFIKNNMHKESIIWTKENNIENQIKKIVTIYEE
jgi:phosphatidylinositol alpha-1,6-mannosyltransferase